MLLGPHSNLTAGVNRDSELQEEFISSYMYSENFNSNVHLNQKEEPMQENENYCSSDGGMDDYQNNPENSSHFELN